MIESSDYLFEIYSFSSFLEIETIVMEKKALRSTIGRDGSIAVKRLGVNPFSISEIYHSLVVMSWWKFFLLLVLFFLCLTLLFTLVNSAIGFEHFKGLTSTQSIGQFLEIFLFNAQTLTTVGGAGITPVGFTNNIVLTIESMVAMLGAATITGLLYVRFSKPTAGIIYSPGAIIAPFKDGKALMIRIANAKKNEVVELKAGLFLVMHDLKTNKRDAKTLSLERAYLPLLAHTFTIVHPINEQSPLYNFSWKDDDQTQSEIGVWLSATDRITGQNVFSGHTFYMHEIVHGARFTSCMDVDDNGLYLIHLDKVGDYELVNGWH
jgi:inward rectifier potassium channel